MTYGIIRMLISVCFLVTKTYLAFRIPGKTSEAVMGLMTALHDEYGENFSRIFKTITVDNGSEFADFAQAYATEIAQPNRRN